MTAPLRILRAAYPHIKAPATADKKAGREVYRKIVNISSTSGLNGNAGHAHRCGMPAGGPGTLCGSPDG